MVNLQPSKTELENRPGAGRSETGALQELFTQLKAFSDNLVLIDRQDLAVFHDQLAVDENRFDRTSIRRINEILELAVVRYPLGPPHVQNDDVGALAGLERS